MTPQRRLYVSMIMSLDGYIDGPNHELDWFDDGNPQFERYCDEMIDSVGFAVYGRRSYELMVQYWPTAEGAFARKMNALPKAVLTKTLTEATWSNTRIVRDVAEIAALKAEPGKPIVAWAGAELVAALTAAGLVDEYRLVVHPVVLGGGTRLFAGVTSSRPLRQVRMQSLGGRVTVLCYEPA
ncbi:MAG TPA: dihydrofolate reductase family protein [Kofleriaceae bacterium]|nr:dihydrofolate reductase family protein [Kofleriaceae bacterium]